MNAPNGTKRVRVVRAELHNPNTPEEYAELTWTTLDDSYTFVENLAKCVGDDKVPNRLGIFATQRWAREWNGVSLADLVAHAAAWSECNNACVSFAYGQRGSITAGEKPRTSEPEPVQDPSRSLLEKLVRLCRKPEVIAGLPDEIEPTRDNAWSVYAALTEGENRSERDRAWVDVCAAFGEHQTELKEETWAKIITILRQVGAKAK